MIMIEEDELGEYFKSEQFRKDFEKIVDRDTWGNNLPKIYLDKKGDIVEHFKDGTINILKTKEEIDDERAKH